MARRKSSLAPFAVLVALFAAVWLYFTPHLAMRRLQTAAEAGDTQALNELVDFPAFRESVKQEVRTAVAREISDRDDPLARLGGMIAGAFASPLVDAFVTPEGIAALAEGRRPSEDEDDGRDGDGGVRVPDMEADRGYEGLDRFVIHFREKESGKERVALVMRRDGIASWKLAGVRLPAERGER